LQGQASIRIKSSQKLRNVSNIGSPGFTGPLVGGLDVGDRDVIGYNW
jgi:hypothetical protein